MYQFTPAGPIWLSTHLTCPWLQNLMNEAAIMAARRELKEISKDEIADALERIIAGPEKKGAVMTEKKKKIVAYHEVRPWRAIA